MITSAVNGLGRGGVLAPGFDRVVHQHGDRHGADATGHGRDARTPRAHAREMHVAGETVASFFGGIGDAVDADVDDHGAGFHHVGRDKLGAADGGDEDIGLARDRSKIARAGVADRNGGVGAGFFLQREQGDGFADNERSAKNDDVLTGEIHAAAGEEFHDARGGAGHETRGIFLGDFAEVERVKTVDVFARRDPPENGEFVEVLGQRRLDENAVNRRVGVEVVDERFQFALRDGDRR